MSLQEFFESTRGQIITVAVMIVLLLLLLIPSKKKRAEKRVDVRTMTVSSVMVALSMVLSLITLFRMPQGGSVTPMSMLPIAIIAYFYGTRVQLLLDYPVAFGALGLGGFARRGKYGLLKCYLIGIAGRYVCAVLSGVIFFGAYAPEGFNAVTWSLWYNFTYIATEGVITVIIISIPAVRRAIESLKKSA